MPDAVAPVIAEVINGFGASDVVLVCEHASNAIPVEFGDLGLDQKALQSHVAWDPGAFDVAAMMSELLDAPLVYQTVSRLLYDCNRPPEAPSAVPEISEATEIPGNKGLSNAARGARVRDFYHPFRDTLASVIEKRQSRGRPPVIVTVHSFTPVFNGVKRSVGIGVLHDADARLADGVLSALKGSGSVETARNQPYGPADGVTHTLVEHGVSRGLLNVMIEIRNNLISSKNEQEAMARRIAAAVTSALGALSAAAAQAQP